MFRKSIYGLALILIIALAVIVVLNAGKRTVNYTQLRPSIQASLQADILVTESDREKSDSSKGLVPNSGPYSTVTRCDSVDDPQFSKPILYMTQTEECGSPYLLSNEALGDPSICRCDVLILSYKRRCQNTKIPHVRYIFYSNTTWNTGRNMLYETARQQKEKYMYYIIMDDDIKLKYKGKFVGDNPWREYEDSLLKEQLPVVGLDRQYGRVERILQHSQVKSCETDFVPTFNFDPMVSAFHYKAISHILPYHTEYDKLSWWYSQYFIHDKAVLMYYGYVALHRRVYAYNPVHRGYPRIKGGGDMHRKSMDEVKEEIRMEFPESLEILNRNLSPRQNGVLARSYCTQHPPPCPTFPAVEWF